MYSVNGGCFPLNNTIIAAPTPLDSSLHIFNARQLDVTKLSARDCIGNRNMRLVCRGLSDHNAFVCITNWNTGASGYWNQSIPNIADVIYRHSVKICGECAKTIAFQVFNDYMFIDTVLEGVIET